MGIEPVNKIRKKKDWEVIFPNCLSSENLRTHYITEYKSGVYVEELNRAVTKI